MKSLFFLYFLSLGIFGLPNKQKETLTWQYSLPASNVTQRTIFVGNSTVGSYPLLKISVYDDNNDYNETNKYHRALYSSFLTYTSPRIRDIQLGSYENDYRMINDNYNQLFGSCETGLHSPPHFFNFTLIRVPESLKNFLYETNHSLINVTIIIELEETLIPDLPYRSHLNTTGNHTRHYRTVRIPPPYENMDLVINIESLGGKLSDLLYSVKLASEFSCFGNFSETTWDIRPQNGCCYNFTVPAKDISYFAFDTFSAKTEEITVDFYIRPSASYIPCLDISFIVFLILSILIYQ